MEKLRDKFFKAIENVSPVDFITLVLGKVKGESGELDINEFFEWLPEKKKVDLFDGLLAHRLSPILQQELLIPTDLTSDTDMDEKTAQTILLNATKTVDIILQISEFYLKKESTLLSSQLVKIKKKKNQDSTKPLPNTLPDSLFGILSLLHDLILPFVNLGEKLEAVMAQSYTKEFLQKVSKIYIKLANDIASLCEQWFKLEKPGREELVPQTVVYLIQRSFESGHVSDIVRLYNFRNALLLLEYNEESSDSLKELLLGCFIQPHFIKSVEGRKMLAFLFSVRVSLVDLIHQVIKGQLAGCKKSVAECYGDVYFRTWQNANGPFVAKLELGCLQELVACAIRCSNQELFISLQTILSVFQTHKKVQGVDAMMIRVYDPILWRSLKYANGGVRCNAARLFFEAFPVIDNESPQTETDTRLQRQFHHIQELLYDPEPDVRAEATKGLCKVLAKFWEIIPLTSSRSLLHRLVTDIIHDKSSVLVRESAVKGIRYLIEQTALSHVLLQQLLPQIQDVINDPSERVRIALVDMLLYVKTISTIRFLDIASLDSLLDRMVQDFRHPILSRKLTNLLVEAYFPHETEQTSEMLNRCIILARAKRNASLAFYSNLVNFVPLISIAKFLSLLFRFVSVQFIEKYPSVDSVPIEKPKQLEEDTKTKTKRKSKKKQQEEVKETKENGEEGEENEEETSITIQDIESLLNIIKSTLDSIQPQLQLQENNYIIKGLLKKFTDETITRLYIWFFSATPPRINSMCMTVEMASIFNIENFPMLRELLLQNFQEIDQSTPDRLKQTLLLSLFSWNIPEKVLEIITSNLSLPIRMLATCDKIDGSISLTNQDTPDRSSNGKKSKRSRKQEEEEEEKLRDQIENLTVISKPANVSLIFFNMLLNNKLSRSSTMEQLDVVALLTQTLISYFPVLQKKLAYECKLKMEEEESNGESEQSSYDHLLPHLDCKLLLSAFVMYGKLLFHTEGTLDTVEKDSGIFQELFVWGNAFLIPAIESYSIYAKDKISKQKVIAKRKQREDDDDGGNEDGEEDSGDNEKGSATDQEEIIVTFPIEILRSYLIILNECLVMGLCGPNKMFELYQMVSKFVDITHLLASFSVLRPIVAKFAYQLFSNGSLEEDQTLIDGSNRLLIQLLDSIDDGYSSSHTTAKASGKKSTKYTFFRLQDLISIHSTRGTIQSFIELLITRVEQNILVQTQLEDTKLANYGDDEDYTGISRSSTSGRVRLVKSYEHLSPSCAFILSCLSRSSQTILHISDHLQQYIKVEKMSKQCILNSLHIISILINSSSNTKSVDCSSLQGILITLLSKLPHLVNEEENCDEEEEETKRELQMEDPNNSNNSLYYRNIKYSSLFKVSNNLLNASMKHSSSTNQNKNEEESSA